MKSHVGSPVARALKTPCHLETNLVRTKTYCSFLFLCTAALTLHAASFVVPSDREMIRRADAIVVGSALTSYTQPTPQGGVETVTPFSVSKVIHGAGVPTILNVVEPGGSYRDVHMLVGGVPQFNEGERMLLLLKRTGIDRWAVAELVLGKFRYATDARARELLVRDADDIAGWDTQMQPYHEPLRLAAPFLRYVDDESHGVRGAEDYFVKDAVPFRIQSDAVLTPAPAVAPYTATSYTMTISGSMGSRWTVFPNGVTLYAGASGEPGAPGNGTTAVQAAINAWDSDCPSNVNYVYGGTDSTHTSGLHGTDGANTVLFERDLSTWGISPFNCGSGGTLGLGGITSASGTINTVNGESFVTTQEADVEMNRGIANCTSLFNSGDWNTAVTHEVGHTLGFRHSDQTRPGTAACTTDPSLECSNQAVMKSFIPPGINAALQAWDQHAVQAVYPGGSCGTAGPAPRRGDLSGDGVSDIFWRNTSTGDNFLWFVNRNGFVSGANPPWVPTSGSIVGTGDFNHDGHADLLWRNTSGGISVWFMNGATKIGDLTLPTVANTAVVVAGVGDFNGDGYADILWRNTATGDDSIWFITANGFNGGATLPTVTTALIVVSVADFNNDGKADILWRNTVTGDNYTWLMNGGTLTGGSQLPTVPPSVTLVGTGDFNGDGTFDLLWRNTADGSDSVWFIQNGAFAGGVTLPTVMSTTVRIVAIGDFDGSGTYDLLWHDDVSGANSIWFINGSGFLGGATLPAVQSNVVKVVSPATG